MAYLSFVQRETIDAEYSIYVPDDDVERLLNMSASEIEEYICDTGDWHPGKEHWVEGQGFVDTIALESNDESKEWDAQGWDDR